ncbi:MAG TPA: glycosyltransferase family 9 protein [Candidatus Kapabacteria bacterium]|nr:glycosyltransferase family 9 protein [Candidatus Kapabacteria bacterium]
MAASPLEACNGMNALIIETAFLGDAIVSLGLAREIKRLDSHGAAVTARVTYLVRPGVEEVIAASPDVDHVLTFDKHGSESGIAGIRKKADELNAFGFDTLFLLHSSRRSQSLASLVNCSTKIGFEAMTHAGLTHTVPDQGWANRYERAILPLRAIASDTVMDSLPRVQPPEVPIIEAFFHDTPNAVALAPGSAWETKRWGDRKFFELAKALTARGLGVIIIGGNEERTLAMNIRDECPEGSVLDLAGRASFLESCSAIARATLLVSNDSAPVHAAVAVGTKVLTIFGPTVPAFGFAPPKGSGEVIELPDLWCRPCTPHGSHTCPIYTHECMEGIGVEGVIDRIRIALNSY